MSKKTKSIDSFSDLQKAFKANRQTVAGDSAQNSDALPAEKSELKDLDKRKQLLQFAYFGKITQCTDRGFGFLEGPEGEEWFHIAEKQGKRIGTLEGLEGKSCVFTKGGAPFRYVQKKSGWDHSVVQWQLADEIHAELTSSNFKHLRSEALLAADWRAIDSLLLAKWYSDLWQKKAGTTPQSVLKADELLKNNRHPSFSQKNIELRIVIPAAT